MESSNTYTIPFKGTCLANSTKVLVSKRITFPFRVEKITASFALNCNHTLQISPIVSPDQEAPATEKPTGSNLLAPYGQVNYLSGDDEQEVHINQTIVTQTGMYLKIYANNIDAFDHTIDAQISLTVIRSLE